MNASSAVQLKDSTEKILPDFVLGDAMSQKNGIQIISLVFACYAALLEALLIQRQKDVWLCVQTSLLCTHKTAPKVVFLNVQTTFMETIRPGLASLLVPMDLFHCLRITYACSNVLLDTMHI